MRADLCHRLLHQLLQPSCCSSQPACESDRGDCSTRSRHCVVEHLNVHLPQAEPPAGAIPPMTDAEIIRHLGSYLFSPENPEYRCAAGPWRSQLHSFSLALAQQLGLPLTLIVGVSSVSLSLPLVQLQLTRVGLCRNHFCHHGRWRRAHNVWPAGGRAPALGHAHFCW